jgi:hypothetical protein
VKSARKHNLLAVPRGVEVSEIGLKITAKLSYDAWADMMKRVQRAHRSMLWILGDGFVYGEGRFGQLFSQAIEEHSEETARNAMWVSSQVPPVRRLTALTWSHHQQVASLEPREQGRFLQEAVDHGWRVHELREAVKAFKLLLEPEPKPDYQEPPDPPEVVVDCEVAEYSEVGEEIGPSLARGQTSSATFATCCRFAKRSWSRRGETWRGG